MQGYILSYHSLDKCSTSNSHNRTNFMATSKKKKVHSYLFFFGHWIKVNYNSQPSFPVIICASVYQWHVMQTKPMANTWLTFFVFADRRQRLVHHPSARQRAARHVARETSPAPPAVTSSKHRLLRRFLSRLASEVSPGETRWKLAQRATISSQWLALGLVSL